MKYEGWMKYVFIWLAAEYFDKEKFIPDTGCHEGMMRKRLVEFTFSSLHRAISQAIPQTIPQAIPQANPRPMVIFDNNPVGLQKRSSL